MRVLKSNHAVHMVDMVHMVHMVHNEERCSKKQNLVTSYFKTQEEKTENSTYFFDNSNYFGFPVKV